MSEATSTRRILLLGAGMVTRPGVAYLQEQGHAVVVASRTVKKAEDLVSGNPRGEAIAFDMREPGALGRLVAGSDLVISLLPAPHHPAVAEACLEQGKPLVTTSYVSPSMAALGTRAESSGVPLLNEIGLDPGIDHMSAMKVIHGVRDQGGRVTSFRSFCGGLPAPEANTNPWGYKFSWSPRAVLTAGLNPARWLEDGQVREVPGPELFAHHFPVDVPDAGTFEGYPNRDSLGYVETYGLRQTRTMLRGTLRNPSWCETLKAVVDLGLLDQTPREDLAGRSHAEVVASLVPGGRPETVRQDVARHLGLPVDAGPLERMAWAGLFSDSPVPQVETLLDLVGACLEDRLSFEPGERDMIVLHHEFVAEDPQGRSRRLLSSLVALGERGGDSAMARTVSLPCAVAAHLMVTGRIRLEGGVHIPVVREIYEPVLAELDRLGIRCMEREED